MPTVGPRPETRVQLIYDTDSGGFGGPGDMNGPEIGEVLFGEPGGNLHIRINVEFGQPNTTYEVFLVGGPSHAMSTGFLTIGTLVTNAVGAGSGAFTVSHGTLLTAPFGPGYRNDHLDLLHKAGDLSRGVLAAGAINYFVCREKDQPGHDQIKAAETHKGAIGQGDPGGATKGAPVDPAAARKP